MEMTGSIIICLITAGYITAYGRSIRLDLYTMYLSYTKGGLKGTFAA